MPLRPLGDLDRHIVHRHYEPRGKNPVPAATSTEAPTYCLKINAHWVGHVVGLLMALDQQDAWVGSGADIEFARNEARKLIASLDLCGDDTIDMGELENCVMPVGSVMAWSGSVASIPDGWLICDGQFYEDITYPDLSAVIDEEFHAIFEDLNGFYVPNLIGRFVLGANPYDDLPGLSERVMGEFGGEENHTLTPGQLPSMNVRVSAAQETANSATVSNANRLAQPGTNIYRNSATSSVLTDSRVAFGGGESHNNMPPFQVLRYIIKAVACEPQTGVALSYKLRQNPENSCLLEQSLDGGTTWLPAFDYNECFGEMKEDVKDILELLGELSFGSGNTYITNIINEYGDEITNIYPDAEYGDDDDINRDAALCFAIAQWTLFLKELIKELLKQENEDDISIAGIAAAGFGAASTIAGALWGFGVAIPGGMFAVGGLAISGAFAAIYDLVQQARDNEVSDEDVDAFDTSGFECCVYSAMAGQTISEALFQNAFTDCAAGEFGTGDIDNLMREMLLLIAQDKGVFVDFLKFLAIAFPLAQAGVAFDCGCAAICDAQDFANDGLGSWTIPTGTLVAGQGIRGVGFGLCQAALDLGMAFNITRIDMEWHCPRNDDAQVYNIQAKLNIGDEWTMLREDDFQPIGAQTDTWVGSFTGRYIRLTAPGSSIAARAGQIISANVCYE